TRVKHPRVLVRGLLHGHLHFYERYGGLVPPVRSDGFIRYDARAAQNGARRAPTQRSANSPKLGEGWEVVGCCCLRPPPPHTLPTLRPFGGEKVSGTPISRRAVGPASTRSRLRRPARSGRCTLRSRRSNRRRRACRLRTGPRRCTRWPRPVGGG